MRMSKRFQFAARAHQGQTVPGSDLPYLVHVASVAAEVVATVHASLHDDIDPNLAVLCAVLHDTIEDAQTTTAELQSAFGPAVAQGVAALTKNQALQSKEERMDDSLRRMQSSRRRFGW